MRECLAQNGPFEVRLIEEATALNAAALSAYDVLLLDYSGPLGKEAEQAAERFVSSGKGLVTVRGLACGFCAAKGAGGSAPSPAPPRVLRLCWTDNRHPVSTGLPDSFLTVDRLRPPPALLPAARVLAAQVAAAGTAADPLVWACAHGKGRIFQTALGEDPASLEQPGYVNLLVRGLEWAATGAVSLPMRRTARPMRKDAVRVLIVTSGHDHRATFYDLFEGYDDIHTMVDPHPFPYRSGLAKRYNVLVLYDSMQDITPAQQKVLQVFGEESRSNHKQFLFRRIAWRIQANAWVGLSERARQRALEIANDADLRIRAPKNFLRKPVDDDRTGKARVKPSLDPRLPMPGTPLIRRFQGKDIIVHVRPDGGFECNGRIYTSLSRAVTEATRTRWK